MKKPIKALTFAAAVMAAGMVAGCTNPEDITCVYGPPPDDPGMTATATADDSKEPAGSETSNASDSETEVQSEPQDSIDVTTIEPSLEYEQDVYGPPPDEAGESGDV